MSEQPWDGIPQDPERNGWHWVIYDHPEAIEPMPFHWFGGEWFGYDGYRAIENNPGKYIYLGPVITPAYKRRERP